MTQKLARRAFDVIVSTSSEPAITYSVICNGENRYMLPLAARGDDYAGLIANIYRDQRRYRQLV